MARKLRLDPLSGVKRRINEVNSNLWWVKSSIKSIVTSNVIAECVQDKRHKDLLYSMLQLDLDVTIENRAECLENVKKYLNLVRPIEVSNLVRIGGFIDGGYVMLPPPPRNLARSQRQYH